MSATENSAKWRILKFLLNLKPVSFSNCYLFSFCNKNIGNVGFLTEHKQ